jgi:pyruvate/2-oxoglutarate/acetoin dehydrogenase E1 component
VGTLLMLDRALAAAEQLSAEGIEVEVIDLRWLRPLDVPAVRASLDKTGALLVVEEQVHPAGWGATLISQLTIGGFQFGKAPRVVGLADDLLIPYSPPIEDQMIPSVEAIAEAARQLCA